MQASPTQKLSPLPFPPFPGAFQKKPPRKIRKVFFCSCRCSAQLWLSQWVGWMLFLSLGWCCLCVVCCRTLCSSFSSSLSRNMCQQVSGCITALRLPRHVFVLYISPRLSLSLCDISPSFIPLSSTPPSISPSFHHDVTPSISREWFIDYNMGMNAFYTTPCSTESSNNSM